jgi:hypothetical protein
VEDLDVALAPPPVDPARADLDPPLPFKLNRRRQRTSCVMGCRARTCRRAISTRRTPKARPRSRHIAEERRDPFLELLKHRDRSWRNRLVEIDNAVVARRRQLRRENCPRTGDEATGGNRHVSRYHAA